MSLRYSFRHLFYGKLFHKDRLYNTLEDLDARITALEESNASAPAETPTEPSNGGEDTPSNP